jgi:hypothetical protein
VFAEPISEDVTETMMENFKKGQVEYEQSLLGRPLEPSADENIDIEPSREQFLKDLVEFGKVAEKQGKSIPDPAGKQAFQDLQDELQEHIDLLETGAELTAEQRSQMVDNVEAIKDAIDAQDDYITDNTSKARSPDGKAEYADKRASKADASKDIPYLQTHVPNPAELLVMQLKVKNYISDEPNAEVQQVPRVSNISAHNAGLWTIKYDLKVVDDEQTKMNMYSQMKARRMSMAIGEWTESFYNSSFMTELVEICREGLRYRKSREEAAKKEKVVMFQPFADS